MVDIRRRTRTLTSGMSSLLARREGGLWRHLLATYHERRRARQGLGQPRPTLRQGRHHQWRHPPYTGIFIRAYVYVFGPDCSVPPVTAQIQDLCVYRSIPGRHALIADHAECACGSHPNYQVPVRFYHSGPLYRQRSYTNC